MTRVFNFSPGPCTLPTSVVNELGAELPDFNDAGMSLIEMSHRSPEYSEVHDDTVNRLKELYEVPDDVSVLLLQGGASLQYAMAPLNALAPGKRAAYINSGAWAKKAIADAKVIGDAYVAWSGEDVNFTRMPSPDEVAVEDNTSYVHLVSNETIGGIRMAEFADYGVPTVADMSSELLSRPIPWDRFDIVYGGAQKNAGPAGVTVVMVRQSVIDSAPTEMPNYLKYATHAKANSLSNTPPVFSIWAMNKMLRWIDDAGGLTAMEERAAQRSGKLYAAIDDSDGFYINPNDVADRSHTNIVFTMASPELEAAFLAESANHNMANLKGHRSVGGIRASIYNGLPDEAVDTLVNFMASFQKANS